ncbi:Leucine-rich repeat-containing G-protein coupled receptor 4 (G-protein coupled receptor 48), partial [Durusdinium trenchii]
MFSMRVIALLAAMYLGGQYFVRYSPSSFRSTVQLFNQVFALKQLEQPGELPEEHRFNWLPSVVLSLPYLALILVLVWDLGSFQAKYRKLKPTQLLYEKYFGVRGRFYSIKVAILQLLTVLLQAFGKLQILGGIVSLSLQQSKLSDVLERCFWTFVGFLCLNSLYPSILFVYPSRKWARLGGAMMDAILDMAYTITYLVFTLLAIYELGLEQEISGNFGDEEAVKFTAKLDPALAFPSDFLGYFAVYYSVAHVCTVCRALERVEHSTMPPSLQGSTSSLLRRANRLRLKKCKVVCKALYSPVLLMAIFSLLLSSNSYPGHSKGFGCFPCRCSQMGSFQQLESCGLAGVLRLKDLSLSDKNISNVTEGAFESSRLLQRLSLSGNPLHVLPKKMFLPLKDLQLLDLGRMGLQSVESETFEGLFGLKVLSLSQNKLQQLPNDLLYPMPALEQLLLGGKYEGDVRRIDGNLLKALPADLLQRSPCLRVLDLSESRLRTLPAQIFGQTPLLQTLDLGQNSLRELPSGIFAGLSNLQTLDLKGNFLIRKLPSGIFQDLSNLQALNLHDISLRELPSDVFAGLSNLQMLHLTDNSLRELPSDVFAGLSKLQTLDLGFNWLGELPPDVFVKVLSGLSRLSHLQTLDLRSNFLSKLPPDALRRSFVGLSNVQAINLWGNFLGTMPAEGLANVFASLNHNVKTLDLGFNFLGQLHPEVPANLFAGLGNLQNLSLKGNALGEVSTEVLEALFASLANLKTLDLQYNSLREVRVEVFAHLKNLERLELGFNSFGELPSEVFIKLFADLSHLQNLTICSDQAAQCAGCNLLPQHIVNLVHRTRACKTRTRDALRRANWTLEEYHRYLSNQSSPK